MSAWPLEIPHADAQRVLKGASVLIVTRSVKPGAYELQDALIVRRNARYRRDGRHDLQASPDVASIVVKTVDEMRLMDLDLAIVRAAGFKTQRDFYDDWYQRRGWIDGETLVRVCRVRIVEPVRMLHQRVHRGYTTDPTRAARDEPSALSASELRELAGAAHRRYEREHAAEIQRRELVSLMARWRQAAKAGNYAEAIRLSRQLARLRDAA